jgi:type I restriction enzyme M protein
MKQRDDFDGASTKGKLGSVFYTPRSVIRVLVEMLEPYEGRVYDRYSGSGSGASKFVQCDESVIVHGSGD